LPKNKEKGMHEKPVKVGDKYICPRCKAQVPVKQDCPSCRLEIDWPKI
jgi:hypothetical protein